MATRKKRKGMYKPVKVETWKIGRIIVARTPDGRIRDRRKWKKDFMLKHAIFLWKQNKSLYPDVKRHFLVKTVETSREVRIKKDKIIRIPRVPTGYVQYTVETKYRAKIISARSRQKVTRISKIELRKQAWDRFLGVLSWNIYGVSDKELGERAIEEKQLVVKEWLVYYTKR